MPRITEGSHARVLKEAREEFLEFGYNGASMRGIGERCNISAAALYRHCINKEDLFAQVVSPCVEKVETWDREHASQYSAAAEAGGKIEWQDSMVDMMREVVYPKLEDYYLLLTRSQGSVYEDYLHIRIETEQKRMMEYISVLRKCGHSIPPIEEQELHILLTAYVTALLEPVVHRYPREQAEKCLAVAEKFFIPAWKQLLDF